MSRPTPFRRGPESFRRGMPSHPPSGKTFLIVTEGEKTEPNYLKALRNLFQLTAAHVEILHPEGTDPITLTQKAIELRKERKNAAKKGNAIAYDEVWVVFDLEKTHDQRRKLAEQARALKEAEGIKFAISDPCFEYWLLLHEKFTTAGLPDCNSAMNRLKKEWKNYAKGQTPTVEFLQKLPTAVTYAEQCRKHHQTSGGDGNPSTTVDLLARSLNEATRAHLRFKLP